MVCGEVVWRVVFCRNNISTIITTGAMVRGEVAWCVVCGVWGVVCVSI